MSELLDTYLETMRAAIAEMEDQNEAFFYKAHLQGMEQLGVLQKQWMSASPADKPALALQIGSLREKLRESLSVLKQGDLR